MVIAEEERKLPEGWKWVRLGEVCLRISNGTTISQNFEGRGLPVTRIETISNGVINPDKVGWVDVSRQQIEKYIMNSGDILFSHINSFERLGNNAIYNGTPKLLVHGMNLLRLEIKQDIFDPYYVLWCLRSAEAKKFYAERARRAIGQASLNIKDLSSLEIPLPPLPEQKRIVAILKEQMAAVEKAKAAAEAQLEAAKALPAAYLREVFPQDKERKLPEGWKWIRLGEVADYINGRAFKPEEWGTKGLPIIRIQNLNSSDAPFNYYDGKVDDKHKVEDGDLLISWSASLDAFIWYRGPAVLNQHIFKVVENNKIVLREYLYFAVREVMKEIKSKVHGATMKHITKAEFEAIKIPLPPLPEQKRIAVILKEQIAEAEKLLKSLEEQLETINKIPAALLRRAFRGEL